ncbi:MAG: hypothetical protein PHX18_07940 [Candidatus Gastranaerophilales bacterium]|nr:hypothetical protein [Candidatus Gastranaerophilales bacterium]
MKNALKIIEALGRHDDMNAVAVLEDVGTNSAKEEIRTETAKALIRRNSCDALRILLTKQGKGVHDLSTKVAMTTVNGLLALEDKTELLKIIDETISHNKEEEFLNTAKSLRALINLSK